jgi:hypothetical protein
METINEKDIKTHFSGDPNVVKPVGDYVTETFGDQKLIDVEHGYDVDGNYIWHISTNTEKRNIPESRPFLIDIINTYFKPRIPEGDVHVWFPNPEWDVKVLTIKGMDLGKKWNFDEDRINKVLPAVCKILEKNLTVPREYAHMVKNKRRR